MLQLHTGDITKGCFSTLLSSQQTPLSRVEMNQHSHSFDCWMGELFTCEIHPPLITEAR